MDEPQGAQYALQIAIYTLRERCKTLQQRVVLLEEENVNLRVQCNRYEEQEDSLSELDHLKQQITQLSEQKEQLNNKVKMVMCENQDLWSKLSKLARVNKTLGHQLTKINDTLGQHSVSSSPVQTTLIRSKTFTKNELETKVLQKNLEENDKISLELEDISLKLSDSFSKQKRELEMLCSEIEEVQLSGHIFTENCGFLQDEELEDDLMEEFKNVSDDLKIFKETVLQQKLVILQNLKNLDILKDKLQRKPMQQKKELLDKCTSTMDLPKTKQEHKYTETEKITESIKSVKQDVPPSNSEKICPMCSKIFQRDVDFTTFQHHVEEHFIPDVSSFEVL